MGRAESITNFIKGYDRDLYCAKGMEGKLCIFRKSRIVESYEVNGAVIGFVRPASHFIFALTDNGRLDGHSVDWGCLPILNRIKASDLWQRDIAGETLKELEETDRSNERAMRNSIESFLYDFRSSFKKTFNDVNTQSLAKIDSRRIGDLKHGNR